MEDLTQYVKDTRAKLWPMVEEVKKQKERAGFSGPFAIIAGKKVSVDDLTCSECMVDAATVALVCRLCYKLHIFSSHFLSQISSLSEK